MLKESIESILLETPLGYEISVHKFEPEESVRQVVLISPATGVKQRYYFKFAEFLSAHGYLVYTYNFGGIGLSKKESLKTFHTSAFNWGRIDFECLLQYALQQHPDQKIAVIGHSIGGQVIGLAPSAVHINKIILVASQSGYWKFWKGFDKFKMLINWHILFPILTRAFGYFPGEKLKMMEDLPLGMALEWNKWCRSPNYLFDYIPSESHYFDQISASMIAYSVSDDHFAPKEAVDWLVAKYKNTSSLSRKHFTPNDLKLSQLGHFGFFKEKMKTTFWKMWLDDLSSNEVG